MNSNYTQKGFTIIELTLALTLLSVLTIILLVSTMNIISIYNKRHHIKESEPEWAHIGDELQQSLRDSRGSFTTYPASPTSIATRACTGGYSYVWSLYGGSAGLTGDEDIDDSAGIREEYKDTNETIGFVKIRDADGKYCAPADPNNSPVPPEVPKDGNAIELLGDGLVIRQPTNFTTNVSAQDRKLISAQFTISTQASGDIIRDTSRTGCKGGKLGEFCGLSTFVVTSYTYADDWSHEL